MAKLNLENTVLAQAATPPAATAPAPNAQKPQPQLVSLAPVSQKSKALLLAKGGRTENAVVRQQIFIRTAVQPDAVPSAEGVVISAIPCAWTVEAYLQRDICFYSITGILGCTDPTTKPLMATEKGQADLPVETACEVFAKPVLDAQDRVIAAIDRVRADALDEDYRLSVKPLLLGGGATITER